MTNRNPVVERVLAAAASDADLHDDAFVMVRRALDGVDVLTGEPVNELPARMDQRGWRKRATENVEVGRHAGWWWRCPRKSCTAWGGPYGSESEAYAAGRREHNDARAAGSR